MQYHLANVFLKSLEYHKKRKKLEVIAALGKKVSANIFINKLKVFYKKISPFIKDRALFKANL